MNKFEYLVKDGFFSLSTKELNELGAQGWELVTVNVSDYIFKREITRPHNTPSPYDAGAKRKR